MNEILKNDSGSRTAILFPGQGAQYSGMGKAFFEKFANVRKTYEEASDILHMDMRRLCFEDSEELNQTKNTQPALITTQTAIFRALKEMGIEPDYLAGLSCGEYSAIVAAGGMLFSDAVRLVRKRGIFMQEAAPVGTTMMTAVIGLPNEKVEDMCKETLGKVEITNYNCSGQVVIGGEKEAVEELGNRFMQEGAIAVKPLNISVASHCGIQKTASEKLRREVESINVFDINIPYISNVSAQPVLNKESIKELLVEQLYMPVCWQQSLEYLLGQGIGKFYEIGADTSYKLLKRISRKVAAVSVWNPEDIA